MEAGEMRRHIFWRNLRLWGRSAAYAQGSLLFATLCGTAVMCFLSSPNKPMVYYCWAIFYYIMMEMIGMLVQQMGYTNRQYPLAIAFGSGRMESVYGMQLSNLLFGITSILMFGIFMAAGQNLYSYETGGLRMEITVKLIMYAEMVIVALAFGQLMAVFSLKKERRNDVYLICFVIISAIIVIGGVVVIFFGWEIFEILQIVNKERELSQNIARLSPMVCHGFGGLGVLLYLIGFFKLKDVMQEYEV